MTDESLAVNIALFNHSSSFSFSHSEISEALLKCLCFHVLCSPLMKAMAQGIAWFDGPQVNNE